MKELAGFDKDLDEEEDLEMLEQEAMMPLHELLAKMKEVGKICTHPMESPQQSNAAHMHKIARFVVAKMAGGKFKKWLNEVKR